MRVHKFFGQYIDLDPIVMISEFLLPEKACEVDSMKHLIWDGRSFSRVIICRVVFQLRDGETVLSSEWPSMQLYDQSKVQRTRDLRVEKLESIRAEYEDLIRVWKSRTSP